MDISNLSGAINSLKQKEWKVEWLENPSKLSLNEEFNLRYRALPEDFALFLTSVKSAVSKDEASWLLCQQEYNDKQSDSFLWNQFELISLEAAREENDAGWEKNITLFWDCHLPIMISVRNGYSYIAVGVCEENFGKIYYGFEPEFEEVELLANSFSEFLEKLSVNCSEYPYDDFI